MHVEQVGFLRSRSGNQTRLRAAKALRSIADRISPSAEIVKKQLTQQDLFITSYPRSGNTWMRAMMAEILLGESGNSLADLDYYAPSTHSSNLPHRTTSPSRIIKSHHPYHYDSETRKYRKVLYIIRDPRDVVLSYYKFHVALKDYSRTLDFFLDDFLSGRIWPCSWQEHVASWLGPGSHEIDAKILSVKYEDLLSNPKQILNQINSFFSLGVREEAINRSIAKTTVDSMRSREAQGGFADTTRPGFKFIDEARQGKWLDQLSDAQVRKIEQLALVPYGSFGYEFA